MSKGGMEKPGAPVACGDLTGSDDPVVKSGKTLGNRMARARKFTLFAVFAAVIVSLAFDSGVGTPSSFGIDGFFLLCPLGGLEAMVASKAFIPVSAISLAVVTVLSLLFGRAWCAWGCPAHVIRGFFKREPRKDAEDACTAEARSAIRQIGSDSRTWTLAAVVVAAFIAGFPLFCLVCPVGLTFGTVGSLWHLIVDKQVTLSVVVFPTALAVELVLYRRWCLDLCPIAGLLGMVGHAARLFRPRVNKATCLRYNEGVNCEVCARACLERIDLHAQDTAVQLGACTRCGECARKCPTASIDFK